jgi:hypothetical protein
LAEVNKVSLDIVPRLNKKTKPRNSNVQRSKPVTSRPGARPE